MLPFFPMTPLLQEWNSYQRRTAARAVRWWEVKLRPPGAARLQLAPTPAETIYRLNKIRLLRYHNPQRDTSLSVPLLLVPSIINKYYIMDLQPGRSMVAYLLQHGFDVWMVDWGTPGPEDRFDTFDDYIAFYLRRLVGRVRRETGAGRISILGYCIGGLFTAIYTALYPDEIANLVNLAGPVDFAGDGLLCTWTRPEHFRAGAIVDAFGNMPGWLMNGAFDALIPGNQLRQANSLWDRLDGEERLRDYLGLRYWLQDEMDFPGETYRKYIRDLYQENLLVQGRLEIAGRTANLAAITCPILSITATNDHIAPAPQVVALSAAVSSADKQTLTVEGGHIGIVAGRDAREKLWPQLAAWLWPRSGEI
ncbi:MAG: alpha/beta fold hydrolase [Chloroflexi bacterium]|nr:alpha/beta fold hydrolase [Chloroflexota bacterium]MCI0575138.1 alpha/beta fold hydrolase [Chloroflexota bacterium]MCI0646287.1 alpha/beta fold hydrolase [Chloroflexota bacterium]MCI0728632.1 alpha/beta fold hydrolase [Chloroflexota bacterium]